MTWENLYRTAAENKLRLYNGREFRAALTILKKEIIINNLIERSK